MDEGRGGKARIKDKNAKIHIKNKKQRASRGVNPSEVVKEISLGGF
ncbi:MAG: hypothetical protein OEW48_13555 [Phycisphaerae bacterium]|nr:hypothetical protein [Phycisphaerae bacterium]